MTQRELLDQVADLNEQMRAAIESGDHLAAVHLSVAAAEAEVECAAVGLIEARTALARARARLAEYNGEHCGTGAGPC